MHHRLFLVGLISLLTFAGWTSPPVSAQTAPLGTGCTSDNPDLTTGLSEQTIMADGQTRRYLLYIPPGYDASQPVPLILSLHGFASNPTQQATYSEWDTLADEQTFIVAYPQGTGFPLRWNSGLRLFGVDNALDDVSFLGTLIETLTDTLCVDSDRVYVNGLSNGGGMTHRLACELADQVAAVGGVAGAYDRQPCEPSRPVPVIAFHGTADTIVPYEGDSENESALPPIEDWAADWAERNGCDAEPTALPTIGAASGVRYDGCEAEVILYTLDGGGHTWPGGGEISTLVTGITNRDINASALMYDFFMAHPLPASPN